MMPRRKYKTNAERQAAYRARQRNASEPIVSPIPTNEPNVTQGPAAVEQRERREDRPEERCHRCQYICHIFGKPFYARVVSARPCPEGKCSLCDKERKGEG